MLSSFFVLYIKKLAKEICLISLASSNHSPIFMRFALVWANNPLFVHHLRSLL